MVLLIDVKAASADEPQLIKALGHGRDIITDHALKPLGVELKNAVPLCLIMLSHCPPQA